MSAVLRGRNVSLDASLNLLAEAAKRELPRHLAGTPHVIMASTFISKEPRFFSIDLFRPTGKELEFRFARHTNNLPSPRNTPSLAIGGSGAVFLAKNRAWMRPLLRLSRAHDGQKIEPHVVADHLSEINFRIHQVEKTVGPRCVVVWTNRKEGPRKGGGGFQFYNGISRAHAGQGDSLPMIMCGMDVIALTDALMPHMMAQFSQFNLTGKIPDMDRDVLAAQVAHLPDTPDEKLR